LPAADKPGITVNIRVAFQEIGGPGEVFFLIPGVVHGVIPGGKFGHPDRFSIFPAFFDVSGHGIPSAIPVKGDMVHPATVARFEKIVEINKRIGIGDPVFRHAVSAIINRRTYQLQIILVGDGFQIRPCFGCGGGSHIGLGLEIGFVEPQHITDIRVLPGPVENPVDPAAVPGHGHKIDIVTRIALPYRRLGYRRPIVPPGNIRGKILQIIIGMVAIRDSSFVTFYLRHTFRNQK